MPSFSPLIPLGAIAAFVVAVIRGWGLLRASALSLALYLITSTFTSFTSMVPWIRVLDAALKGAEIVATVLASLTLVEMMREDGVLDDIVRAVKEVCHPRDSCLVGITIIAAGALESVASFGTPATLVAPLLVESGLKRAVAAAAALVAHAPFGTFAAFGVPILVTSEISRVTSQDLVSSVALDVVPALIVLPYAVGETADLKVSRIMAATMVILSLAALSAIWWTRSPSLAGPLLVLGVASGFLWFLRLAGDELRVKLADSTVKGVAVYGLAILGVGLAKMSGLKWVQPWMLLWAGAVLYTAPEWKRVLRSSMNVLKRTWEELASIVLLMAFGTLISCSALPKVIRPYAAIPPIAFLLGFFGEMVVGSTTAVMATFASGTPHPGFMLVGAACAAAACPYNVAVAAAAVGCHERRAMRRSLLGSLYLTVPTLIWCTVLWAWGAS